jgi:hypothetical protein
VAERENIETELEKTLATARRPPSGANATAVGPTPVASDDTGTEDNAPVVATENTDTDPGVEAELDSVTARKLPLGENAIDPGSKPTKNGEPGRGKSAPAGETENIDTAPVLLVTTASRRPFGLNASDRGWVPTGNGEPGTGASMPATETVAIDTVPASGSVVANSSPLGLKAILGNSNELPAGETETGESAPPTATPATVVPPGSAKATNPRLGLNATDDAPTRAENGEPSTRVNSDPAAHAPETQTVQTTKADHNENNTTRTTAPTIHLAQSCAPAPTAPHLLAKAATDPRLLPRQAAAKAADRIGAADSARRLLAPRCPSFHFISNPAAKPKLPALEHEHHRRPTAAALLLYLGDLHDARGAPLPLLDESSHVGQSDDAAEIGAKRSRQQL